MSTLSTKSFDVSASVSPENGAIVSKCKNWQSTKHPLPITLAQDYAVQLPMPKATPQTVLYPSLHTCTLVSHTIHQRIGDAP